MAGQNPHWVRQSHGQVPSHAVQGGHDGGPIYVGRAHHGGDLIPGKVLPSHHACYISHAGNEHSERQYEVLCNNSSCQMRWISSSNGSLPLGAIQGGKTSSGEPLYIGRTHYQGTLTVGKVHPSHRCLYFPYGGKEQIANQYEVLVCATVTF